MRETSEPHTRPSATLSPSDGERDEVRGFPEIISGDLYLISITTTQSTNKNSFDSNNAWANCSKAVRGGSF